MGWIHFSIGSTWVFVRLRTEASLKRAIWSSLRGTSYSFLTSSCKRFVGDFRISLSPRTKEDLCLRILVRLNGGRIGFPLWSVHLRTIDLCRGVVG